MSYLSDRAYGERFIPLVQKIVGPNLLSPSPFEVDTKRATDLIVLRAEAVEIGVRIRRLSGGYFEKWPNDFTIRSKRDTGAETELKKICGGWMTWMFYGHGGPEEDEPWLAGWMLVDIRLWRRAIMRIGWDEAKRRRMVACKSNGDGTHFIACDVTKYPPDLLIDASISLRGE